MYCLFKRTFITCTVSWTVFIVLTFRLDAQFYIRRAKKCQQLGRPNFANATIIVIVVARLLYLCTHTHTRVPLKRIFALIISYENCTLTQAALAIQFGQLNPDFLECVKVLLNKRTNWRIEIIMVWAQIHIPIWGGGTRNRNSWARRCGKISKRRQFLWILYPKALNILNIRANEKPIKL